MINRAQMIDTHCDIHSMDAYLWSIRGVAAVEVLVDTDRMFLANDRLDLMFSDNWCMFSDNWWQFNFGAED